MKRSSRDPVPQVMLLDPSGFNDPALPISVALAAGAEVDDTMLAACCSSNLDSAFVLEFLNKRLKFDW